VVKSSLFSGRVESWIRDRHWLHRNAGSVIGKVDEMTEISLEGCLNAARS